MKTSHSEANVSAREEELAMLVKTIERIGIARFVGRVNSGVIPSEQGYAAVEQYIAHAKERPLLSRLTHLVLSQSDTYAHR